MIRQAQREGYHNRPERTVCPVCNESLAGLYGDTPCECGWFDEFFAARRYANGKGGPMVVSAVAEGGHYESGFEANFEIESRDAWDFRSALKAARWLRDSYGKTYRTCSHNHRVFIQLSYRGQQ
jgi:hypothetical protein